MVKLSHEPLDVNEVLAHVEGAEAGGVNVFIGTVRNATEGKKVVSLEFEAYEKMAVAELEKIAVAAKKRWKINKVAIHHALGEKQVGELAVVIAVSAPHRDAAFKACRFVIDTLKQTVPIWKKEIFEDGEVWVAAHP